MENLKVSRILNLSSFLRICIGALIEMEKIRLASKIRVVKNHNKFDGCSENHQSFYTKYATIVSKTLRQPIFQNFLKWLIKKEQIDNSVKDIQIRVLPFMKSNGKTIAGRCSSSGIIRIFPKRKRFLRKKLQVHKKEKINAYIRSRAMASLIHEILHIKYEGNEPKVRKLTKKYFNIFIRNQNPNPQRAKNIQNMLFKTM